MAGYDGNWNNPRLVVKIMHDAPALADVEWPLEGSPVIWRADRFAHGDRYYATQYQGATHALHLYDYHGSMRLDGRQIQLEPGLLTLSPANHVSSYHLPQPGHHWCIHFLPLPARGRLARLPLVLGLDRERASINEQFREIARLHALSFRRGSAGRIAAAAASASLQALLLRLAMLPDARHQATVERGADDAIERVVAIINEALDHSLEIPELAAAVGLSQNYLARCFRRQFGVTMPRYILQRRIDVARQLLRSTDLQVKAVAARVGMPDPQHFNKQFRHLTGLSPTLYRQTKLHEPPTDS